MVKAMSTIVVSDPNMVERVAVTVALCVNPSNPKTVDNDARVSKYGREGSCNSCIVSILLILKRWIMMQG